MADVSDAELLRFLEYIDRLDGNRIAHSELASDARRVAEDSGLITCVGPVSSKWLLSEKGRAKMLALKYGSA